MIDLLKKIFLPPVFEDNGGSLTARYLNNFLNISFVMVVILIVSGQYAFAVNLVFALIAAFTLGLHFLLHAGKLKLAIRIFVSLLWLSMTYLAWVGAGIKDAALVIYLIIIFLSTLFGHKRLSAALIALSIVSVWLLFFAETAGRFVPVFDTLLADTFSLTSIFVLFGALLYFTAGSLEKALLKSQESEQELIEQNKALLALQEDLEEKTRNLEVTSVQTREQAQRLQVIAKISQEIALTKNTETLLPEVARLTSERFGFYHVGVFSLSTDKKYVQLKATSSDGGKKMLQAKYQVKIGSADIVGRVAHDRRPSIVLDDGDAAVSFNNPDLPKTHSEIALPLIYGDELLGVLDVQSEETLAFDESDIEAFSILANQIAIVIENMRQLERAQSALEEMEEVSRHYIRQEWSQLLKGKREKGARYIQGTVEEIEDAQPAEDDEETSSISIPIMLRKEVIGMLKVHAAEKDYVWREEDVELMQAIADRAALALENARLLETTTRRARRERLVSEVTSKIRSTNDPDKMVQTTMEELKKILGVSKVELRAFQPKVAETENSSDE